MTLGTLQELCAEWQKHLRLQDWDINIRFVRHWDLNGTRGGEVTWIIEKKTARISILDPGDYAPHWIGNGDTELTLVHELLHLHFACVDDTPGLKEKLFEQAVHSLSSALVALKRTDAPRINISLVTPGQ